MHLSEKYFNKAKKLLEEAEKDYKIGSLNKATSAYYFAVEAIVNAISSILKQKN